MFIMSNIENEDSKVEELFKNMPKFTDHRSKEEVYDRVRIEMEVHQKKEKRYKVNNSISRWMPIVISVASIILLSFLVTSFFTPESTMQESGIVDPNSSEKNMRSMDVEEEKASEGKSEMAAEQNNDMAQMSSYVAAQVELLPLNDAKTAVYDDSLNGGTVFHFSLLENALSVPITIIIPKEQIENDFPNTTPNSLQLYERYAALIDEEALGFTNYHPYKGYFVAEGNVLQHYLPENHGYDTAPGTAVPYWTSINEIFIGFEAFARLNEDGTPIIWDQAGTLNEPTTLVGTSNRNYFKYVAFNGETYLAPSFNNTFNTVSDAFENMKQSENDVYSSVIPNGVSYSYRDDNGIAIIRFDQPLDLTSLSPPDATHLIEAFALTAASFGTEVKLENVVQQEWEGFDLTTTLPIPLGPNGFMMNIK